MSYRTGQNASPGQMGLEDTHDSLFCGHVAIRETRVSNFSHAGCLLPFFHFDPSLKGQSYRMFLLKLPKEKRAESFVTSETTVCRKGRQMTDSLACNVSVCVKQIPFVVTLFILTWEKERAHFILTSVS